MNCSSCGYENPGGMKFCGSCGAGLRASGCPRCGFESPPGFKFCGECGTTLASAEPPAPERDPRDYTPKHLADRILQSKSALEGERKQVTVLFADVKGSMDLAEQVDPEEWYAILDRFFQILAEGVHRFEGTVNQYTGDGIMALFGAPISHEDHAQRACYAALYLSDELRRHADELRLERGLSLATRMGLNSGEVVVGKIGDDLRMDYTALGHTVGLAARMEQIAEPGKVYLSQNTAGLVEGFFELRDLGQSKVRGAHEPVRIYELRGVGRLRTRLQVARARGFSKFVGREREIDILRSALAQAIDGNGQVVGVVGEAGIGKSRLCLEMVEGCRTKGLKAYEAHCPAHGKTVPLLLLLDLLRNFFGISEHDGEQKTRETIAGRLLLLDRGFEETLPLVFELLGVPDPERPVPRMAPDTQQQQLNKFVRRLVRSASAREVVILLVDDLHWVDSASNEFLAQMVEAVPETRTLLLVNFRPEYHADWVERSHYQRLPLVPLGQQSIEELLRGLIGQDPSVAALPGVIHERTGGNPFFIEEVVQSLVESGSLEGTPGAYQLVKPVEALEVPTTVQPVLAARIDRLPEREKQVLQTAAVIGKKFTEPILKRVAELPDSDLAASLSALQAAEFIFEEALYPEAAYTFRHPLSQEVAYGSQLGERRARVHGAVARAIEEVARGQRTEMAGLLAHHWEEAGDAGEAARWHGRAAQWVGSSNATEVMARWRKVRTLLATVPESEKTMAMEIAACAQILNWSIRVGISNEEADTLFAEGRELATRLGDTRLTSMLQAGYATVKGNRGDARDFFENIREAARLADQTNDVAWQLASRPPLVWAHWTVGRLREAVSLADDAHERFPHDAQLGARYLGFSPYLMLFTSRATALSMMGRCEEAIRGHNQALTLAREQVDREVTFVALSGLGEVAFWQGDAEKCLSLAQRIAASDAEMSGHVRGRGVTHLLLARAYLLKEEWGRAVAALGTVGDRPGSPVTRLGLGLALLARAHLGSGDLDQARARAEEGVALADRQQNPLNAIEARLALSQVLLRTERKQAAPAIGDLLARALSLVDETEARRYEPFLRAERAELARLEEDEAARERDLREAHRLFTKMGATVHAERVARQLDL